ncbi:MAG TPA: phosphoglycerate mutase, partial [Clostridiaceae bacterium]|nr:phosphoglycerate mutase [Clostridiaceae bacterium]
LRELRDGRDFVYIHIEAPDECGHQGQLGEKIRAIELIDKEVLGTLLQGLEDIDEYRLLLLPDHPTPIAIRTHCGDPVPFVFYDSRKPDQANPDAVYTEAFAKSTGVVVKEGHKLMDIFLEV